MMSELNISLLKKRRDELQRDLQNVINLHVELFKTDTDVQIDYISVNMISVETIGRPPERIVGTVTVDLDI